MLKIGRFLLLLAWIYSSIDERMSQKLAGPVEKEKFEEERKTVLASEKKKILRKLDDVMSRMKHDPSLGYPVVHPKPGHERIVRHILLFNRLSPPNSLSPGEMSFESFYAWLDASPGRQCTIRLTVKGSENVHFPDMQLKSSQMFSGARSASAKMFTNWRNLKDEITLEWKGLVTVRNLRMHIPVIIWYAAETESMVELIAGVPRFITGVPGFRYQAFIKPKVLRWKVGPKIPVSITINNDKRIQPAVPDGRNRKFKIKFNNPLVTRKEFIKLYIAPFIPELEVSPLSYFYGMELSIKRPFSLQLEALKTKRKKMHRIDDKVPFFQYHRFWPWVLCHNLEIIPADKKTIGQIAQTIPDIWEQYGGYKASIARVFRLEGENKRKFQKDLRKYCKRFEERICFDPDTNRPSQKHLKTLACGRWPVKWTTTLLLGQRKSRKIRYRVHPMVPLQTPITMIFGYVAGTRKTGNLNLPAERNPRFELEDAYLRNQFVYVSQTSGNRMLRARCDRIAEIGETKCCKVHIPMSSFTSKNTESEFDLLVVPDSPNIETISYYTRRSKPLRLYFRKAKFDVANRGKRAAFEYMCYKTLDFGQHRLRFEILPPCYGLRILCDGLTQRSAVIANNRDADKMDQLPPKDFLPPPRMSIVTPQTELDIIHIVVSTDAGNHRDISAVTNENEFELRIFFVGKLRGRVVITPFLSKFFEFQPKFIEWRKGDSPFGKFKVIPSVDCPSPTRIFSINYHLNDDLIMWKFPSPTFLQIMPNPKNAEEVKEVALPDSEKPKSLLCALPDDYGMDEGVINGTIKEIAEEVMCIKHPALCETKLPPPPPPDPMQLYATYMLYVAVGLLGFAIVYRNCFGSDNNAMLAIQLAMSEINKSDQRVLPKDAVNADEFFNLAGLNEDEVFSATNPDPMVIAEAQLSLQKMLSTMKR
eukprot:CAMPEP_0202723612 /NCGR_PEP_ID=MMETSP1385-20130828/167032_1 /ASSEMBLY_ACC=CAM_ASM_000861 /TAXON_ID=933848 /ORGANISM="Elphidium margaritaceum" /LENGTH=928 /DNA_ID=CAMNT_0049388853 /DNA_START=19 /DNA_END=2805 /DNA_ORIENTATION=-